MGYNKNMKLEQEFIQLEIPFRERKLKNKENRHRAERNISDASAYTQLEA